MVFKSRAFWWGFTAGLGTLVLAILGWLAAAWYTVDRNLDRIEAEHAERGRPLLSSPPVPGEITPGAELEEGWMLLGPKGEATRYGSLPRRTRVLTHWTSWCQPCQAELPHLQELDEEIREQGVEILLFSTESPDELRRVLDKRPLPLPVWTVRGIPAAIWSAGPPATHVVDCDGRVVFSHVGAARWDEQPFVDFVRRVQASCGASTPS